MRRMARISKPASSMRWMIWPASRRSTASGLTIASVRSITRTVRHQSVPAFLHWRWGPTPSANLRRCLASDLLVLGSAWPQALAKAVHDLVERLLARSHSRRRQRGQRLVDQVQRRKEIVAVGLEIDQAGRKLAAPGNLAEPREGGNLVGWVEDLVELL